MTTKELLKPKISFEKIKKLFFSVSKKNSNKKTTKKININFSLFSEKNLSISAKDKINFFDNLYNLLNSGIPFVNSIKLMIVQTKNKKLEKILNSILKDINSGKKLSEAMLSFPKIFKNFDVAITQMGEQTGDLPGALNIIKDREEKAKDIKSKIIGALIYPSIIVILAISMIITFLVFVIPKISKMYKDARVDLPDLTKKVINTSNFLQEQYPILITILFLIIAFITFLKKYKKTKIYFDKFILSIPIFGNLIKKKILVVFSQTFGTLLKSGVLINKALEITKKSLENDAYAKKIDEMIVGVASGENLSKHMGIGLIKQKKEDFFFPIELASIIKIGEETGNTDELLLKISKKYKKELDNISKNIGTAIEPVVIIFVGGIIGTIIMAILMPFFKMVNVVG